MSFIEAIRDYQSGRLKAAREKLTMLEGIDSKLLYVRIHTRLRDTTNANGAIELARDLLASGDVELRDRIQAGILLSFLLARTGGVGAADRCIQETKQLARKTTMTLELESELWFGDAVVLFAQGRSHESERSAWNAIYADLEFGHCTSETNNLMAPIQTTKARAFVVLGLIRASQERYHEQYRFLREAMVLLRTAPAKDLYLIGVLHANRSFYARDLGVLSEIVEFEALRHEPWPEDIAESRLEIARSLGYLYALKGDDGAAISSFREASNYTVSDANRLLLVSDEAYISRQRELPSILYENLAEGCRIADLIDWESIDVERYALHAFAQELSVIDSSRASAYMNHYLKLESRANPLDVSDKRALAEAQYSSGLVGLAAGRRDYGLDALAKAYEIWREVGFRWRATAAAIELADVSGNAGFASYAARESQQYPKSWLARRVLKLGVQVSRIAR